MKTRHSLGLILLLSLMFTITLTGCKKEKIVIPVVVEEKYVSFKMGDHVKWVSPSNPIPDQRWRIVALYYNDPLKPINAGLIPYNALGNQSIYTVSCTELVLWK